MRVVVQCRSNLGDGGGILKVPTGCSRHEQKVVTHHRRQRPDVRRPQAEPLSDPGCQLGSDHAVVGPTPLPMSCSSAPSTSRSGRATRVVKALARETASTR